MANNLSEQSVAKRNIEKKVKEEIIEETSDQSNQENNVENDTNTRNEISRDSLDDLPDVAQYLKKKESCHMPSVIFGTPKREAVRQTVKPILIKKEDLDDPSSDIETPNTVMSYWL